MITTENTEDIHDRWNREHREKTDAMRAKVKAIAQALGETYAERDADNVGEIRFKNPEQGLHLYVDYRGKKMSVSGYWPTPLEGSPGYQPHPSGNIPQISVSFERDAAAIAKDIQRRFLPNYHIEFAKLVERKARDAEYRNLTQTNVAYFEKTLGVKAHGKSVSFPDGSLECSGASVTFKFYSVSFERAVQLVNVIKTWKA